MSIPKPLRLCQLLDLKNPIIQSPMAGITTTKLAAAVTNSGGLGSLALAPIDLRKGIKKLEEYVDEYKSLVNGNSNLVNLNFFCHDIIGEATVDQQKNLLELYRRISPSVEELLNKKDQAISFENGNLSFKEVEQDHPEILDELLEYLTKAKPRVVSFHFGLPRRDTIQKLKDRGILVFASACSVSEAKKLIEEGIDGIICQGYEAGGHRGNFLVPTLFDENLSTFSLFHQVQEYVKLHHSNSPPFLIPAGGIMDAQTIHSYLKLGADAVQMGTVFLATPESSSNNFIREEVRKGTRLTTIMTPLVSGKSARAIKTPFIESIIKTNAVERFELPPYGRMYNAYKCIKGLVRDPDLGFYLAGQNYHSIDPDLNAGEIVQKLADDLNALDA